MQKAWNESMVEMDKTDKGLYFLLVRWGGPVCYSGDFDWIHFDLVV
jgi:hypothetical protein